MKAAVHKNTKSSTTSSSQWDTEDLRMPSLRELEASTPTFGSSSKSLNKHDNTGNRANTVTGKDAVTSHYEKLLLSTPTNNGQVWIEYIAAMAELGDLDHCRALYEKALRGLDQRDELSRINLWTSRLNFEAHCCNWEGLRKAFETAMLVNDPLTIHLQYCKLLANAPGKQVEAEKAYYDLVKGFRSEVKAWLAFLEFAYKSHNEQLIKKVSGEGQRALHTEHPSVSLKFQIHVGQQEYKWGSAERARAIFESMLAKTPKRLDLWLVFLTLEENRLKELNNDPKSSDNNNTEKSKVNNINVEFVRRLYKRVCSLKLSSKKAKFFFKRFLDFEKAHGNDATQEAVKQLAIAYVNAH